MALHTLASDNTVDSQKLDVSVSAHDSAYQCSTSISSDPRCGLGTLDFGALHDINATLRVY